MEEEEEVDALEVPVRDRDPREGSQRRSDPGTDPRMGIRAFRLPAPVSVREDRDGKACPDDPWTESATMFRQTCQSGSTNPALATGLVSWIGCFPNSMNQWNSWRPIRSTKHIDTLLFNTIWK